MCFPLGLKPLLLTFLIFPPVSFSDYLVFFFLSFARKTNILDTIYSSKTTYTVGAHLNDKLCYNLARKSPVYSMKELETVLMFNSIRWLSETLRRDELSLFLPLFYMVFFQKKSLRSVFICSLIEETGHVPLNLNVTALASLRHLLGEQRRPS